MIARPSCLSAAFLCLVAVSPSASVAATIVGFSQARSVTATASYPGSPPSSNTVAAPDFAPFNATASASSGPGPSERFIASAHQTSTIGPDAIDLTVDGGASLSPFGAGTGSASSLFDVTFDLLVESEFFLFHTATLNQFTNAGGSLSDSQGGVLFDLTPFTAESGVLSAGRYRLQAFANGNPAFGDEGRMHQQINFSFTPIPEPATASLLASGLVVLAAVRRARRSGFAR